MLDFGAVVSIRVRIPHTDDQRTVHVQCRPEAEMAGYTIYLGNKNYSSWSLRGWLAIRQTGVEFEERVFRLGAPGIRDEIARNSPTSKVPSLRHGEHVIWDSLAMAEYLAERFPQAGLWPEDVAARAVARSVSAEMHSSFQALRQSMPLNVRRRSPGKGRTPQVLEDIARIEALWGDCRERFGGTGEFLFDRWCLADAMFAPVVSRFDTYVVETNDVAREYMASVRSHPWISEWRDAAEAESAVESQFDL